MGGANPGLEPGFEGVSYHTRFYAIFKIFQGGNRLESECCADQDKGLLCGCPLVLELLPFSHLLDPLSAYLSKAFEDGLF